MNFLSLTYYALFPKPYTLIKYLNLQLGFVCLLLLLKGFLFLVKAIKNQVKAIENNGCYYNFGNDQSRLKLTDTRRLLKRILHISWFQNNYRFEDL